MDEVSMPAMHDMYGVGFDPHLVALRTCLYPRAS